MSHETPILVAPRPVYFFTRTDDMKVSFNDPALEEFLSILKPSGAANNAKRPHLTSPPAKSTLGCENARDVTTQTTQTDEAVLDLLSITNDTHLEPDPPRNWLSSNLLSSPVSRMHTRNPFLRHCDTLDHVSPAAVPLPTPTPSEELSL